MVSCSFLFFWVVWLLCWIIILSPASWCLSARWQAPDKRRDISLCALWVMLGGSIASEFARVISGDSKVTRYWGIWSFISHGSSSHHACYLSAWSFNAEHSVRIYWGCSLSTGSISQLAIIGGEYILLSAWWLLVVFASDGHSPTMVHFSKIIGMPGIILLGPQVLVSYWDYHLEWVLQEKISSISG